MNSGSDFFLTFQTCSVKAKTHLKLSIFELKSLFISCKFNIHGVIDFYGFLWQLKKSLYAGDSPIYFTFRTSITGIVNYANSVEVSIWIVFETKQYSKC